VSGQHFLAVTYLASKGFHVISSEHYDDARWLRDSNGYTLAHLAVLRHGCADMLRILRLMGANMNLRDDHIQPGYWFWQNVCGSDRPMKFCIVSNKLEHAEELLLGGARANDYIPADPDGFETPWMLNAIEKWNLPWIRLFLRYPKGWGGRQMLDRMIRKAILTGPESHLVEVLVPLTDELQRFGNPKWYEQLPGSRHKVLDERQTKQPLSELVYQRIWQMLESTNLY
jgi:hypothetical protein